MAVKGEILRPSDRKKAKSVLFVQCAGSRDENHLPYCSATCCANSLKQAMYIRERNPEAEVTIVYRDMRTPGQGEFFYQRAQEDAGIFLTKGVVTGVTAAGGKIQVAAKDTLLGPDVKFEADLVVLATGMVPTTVDEPILNLTYRQGPALPTLNATASRTRTSSASPTRPSAPASTPPAPCARRWTAPPRCRTPRAPRSRRSSACT